MLSALRQAAGGKRKSSRKCLRNWERSVDFRTILKVVVSKNFDPIWRVYIYMCVSIGCNHPYWMDHLNKGHWIYFGAPSNNNNNNNNVHSMTTATRTTAIITTSDTTKCFNNSRASETVKLPRPENISARKRESQFLEGSIHFSTLFLFRQSPKSSRILVCWFM